MAKIPDSSNVQRAGTGGLRPRAVRVPNMPQANAFNLVGRDLAQLAQVGAETEATRRRAKVSRAAAQAQYEIDDFNRDLARESEETVTDWETGEHFSTFAPRYRQKIEEVLAKYGEGLDERARADLETRMEPFIGSRALAVRKLAEAKINDRNLADLDISLRTHANLAARAGNDLERQSAIRSGLVAIDELKNAGALDAVEAGKRVRSFMAGIDSNRARALILSDPMEAEKQLLDGQGFSELDEKQRLNLLSRAQAASDRVLRERNRLADQSDKDAKKRIDAEADDALKTFYTKMAAARETDVLPTVADLDQLRRSPGVKPAEYKGALEALTRFGDGKDDPEFIASFMPRIDDEDVSDVLIEGLRTGKLTTGSYVKFFNQNRAALKDDRPDTPYKSGRKFLATALDPGQLGGDGTIRQPLAIAQARALADYDTFFEANEGTSRQDAFTKANELVEQYQNVAFGDMKLALPRPRGFVGRKSDVTMETVKAAQRDLAERIRNGTISKAEASREIEALDTWEAILTRENRK